MPTFRKRKQEPTGERSPWFVKMKNYSGNSPPVWTFQIQQPGIRLLRNLGLDDGDLLPNREFRILQDLGLVYTLDDADIGSPSAIEFTGQDSEELSPDKRVEFVKELLREYTLDELSSESFDRLLSGIDEGPTEPRDRLIRFLTTPTPVGYEHIEEMAKEYPSNPALCLALVCYAFSEFTETLSEDVQGYVTPIAFKREWVYLLAHDFVWDLGRGLCNFHYRPPKSCPRIESSGISLYSWAAEVLARTHTAQFLDDIYLHLKQASKAVDAQPKGDDFILIVPQHAVDRFDPGECLNLSAIEKEGHWRLPT